MIDSQVKRVTAPRSWKQPENHWVTAISHPWYINLVKLQHHLQMAAHNFFSGKGLLSVTMPITTSSISSPMGLGSDSLPVEVNLMGAKTYLADSMQFMLEFGCRLHPQGVYYIMPCFRGEATDQYHLPQFYHVEAEIPGSLQDVIELSSQMLHFITHHLYTQCGEVILHTAGSLKHVQDLLSFQGQFPTIRMQDAEQELAGGNPAWLERHPAGFTSITRAGEQELVRRHGKGIAVWLTHFDRLAVPFYQGVEAETGRALNADLILGNCETIGSGQRHQYEAQVVQALDEHHTPVESYGWYVRMREKHPMLTSGFGMGMERYLLWVLQHEDIRDMTVLYRENGLDVLP